MSETSRVAKFFYDQLVNYGVELIGGILVTVGTGILIKGRKKKPVKHDTEPPIDLLFNFKQKITEDEYSAPEGYTTIKNTTLEEKLKSGNQVVVMPDCTVDSVKDTKLFVPGLNDPITINPPKEKTFSVVDFRVNDYVICTPRGTILNGKDLLELAEQNGFVCPADKTPSIYYRGPEIGTCICTVQLDEPIENDGTNLVVKQIRFDMAEGLAVLVTHEKLNTAWVHYKLPRVEVNKKRYVVYNTNVDTHGAIFADSIIRLFLGINDPKTPTPKGFQVMYLSEHTTQPILLTPTMGVRLVDGIAFEVLNEKDKNNVL